MLPFFSKALTTVVKRAPGATVRKTVHDDTYFPSPWQAFFYGFIDFLRAYASAALIEAGKLEVHPVVVTFPPQ